MAANLTGIALVLTDPGMEANPWPLIFGNLIFFGSIAYIFWYSNLGERNNAMLNEGEKLPVFELHTLDGESFSSEKFKGAARSEERRVGKECVSTCRSRWSPYT